MTSEQLEELIEQKGTVYNENGLGITLYSKSKCKILPKYDGKEDYLLVHYLNAFHYFPISQLIDKEHYEWRQKTVAEYIQRFEPPMWEDINISGGYLFRFLVNGNLYEFLARKRGENNGSVYLRNISYSKFKYAEENGSAKENYEKACKIVRNLLNKGDEK